MMVNPIVRSVLELANRIQGRILAFERHPDGGVTPAFPVMSGSGKGRIFVYGEDLFFAPDPPDGTWYALSGENAGSWVESAGFRDDEPETVFIDETGEYTGTPQD